jgi:hypothetical protein
MIAKNVTLLDERAVEVIRAAGFIGVDADGQVWMETSGRVSPGRLRRLITLGLVAPSNDALMEWMPSHTYRVVA